MEELTNGLAAHAPDGALPAGDDGAPLIDPAALEALRAKHGTVFVVTAKDGDGVMRAVVVRKPTREEYKQYRTSLFDEAKRADANEMLLRKVCVHPDPRALSAMLDDWPFLADVLGNRATESFGGGQKAEAKKF